ncbi:uncharacterized protein LOC118424474 [Branchiostoma floridae]|uniref:Uncharacterized protein LOC118424474 n=1 Tax=Branchiostoma floridae TaxID=7739 RepID=A0A9J7N4A9_BRAFL|nr:uncharacterized protein LOC118424474 [Branchiostoma floridae]
METWRLSSGRSATITELKKALVEAGLKLVADEMDDHIDAVLGNQSPLQIRHHHGQRLTLTVHIQEGSVHMQEQGWNSPSEILQRQTEFPAADDTAVSVRTTPMMFQTMPCQGTFGNRKRDKVCHEMVTQLEKLAWQGHWQKLGRFASRASRRYKDQPDVVIRVIFEVNHSF